MVMCMHTFPSAACTLYCTRTSGRTRSLALLQKERVRARLTITAWPLFFFLGVVHMELVRLFVRTLNQALPFQLIFSHDFVLTGNLFPDFINYFRKWNLPAAMTLHNDPRSLHIYLLHALCVAQYIYLLHALLISWQTPTSTDWL
jgi:hypothetical protein